MEPVTRKEMFLARAAGQDVPLPEPCTREEMFLKKIAERGTSSDWNAKEGEDGHVLNRTHYRELVELLPETAGTYSDEIGGFVFDGDFAFTAGKTYYVTWNGVEYTCVAWAISGAAAIGNKAVVELGDTGEPFTMIVEGGTLCAVPLVETLEAIVSISTYQYTTLPREYLPPLVHWIDAVEVDGVHEQITVTPAQTQEAINAGLDVRLRISKQDSTGQCVHILPCVTQIVPPDIGMLYQLIFCGKTGLIPTEKIIHLTMDMSSGSGDMVECSNLPWVVASD